MCSISALRDCAAVDIAVHHDLAPHTLTNAANERKECKDLEIQLKSPKEGNSGQVLFWWVKIGQLGQ